MTDHYTEQREADDIWRNAPIDAGYYNAMESSYYKLKGNSVWVYDDCQKQWLDSVYSRGEFLGHADTVSRPQPKQPVIAQDALKPQNAYQRTIIGLDGSKCVCDVYRVLEAFEVDSHAIAHSIKKLLAPGKRHAKSREQDLREAIASIEAELLLMEQRR